MSAILDPSGFIDAARFIHEPEAGSPLWAALARREPEEDAELGWRCFDYPKDGLEVQCTWDGQQYRFSTLYFDFATDRAPFKHPGPFGLARGMAVDDIIAQLGPPLKTGGDHHGPVVGYQRPWIKYFPRDRVQLMVEHQDGQIWRAHVGAAIW